MTFNLDDFWLSARLLLLLAVANGAPVVAKNVFGTRWNAPLDGGWRFVDGRPLLGPSKTVRGFVAAVAGTAVAAALMGFSLGLGSVLGTLAMLGDALSSFVKRRLGIASSGRAIGIDQIPEALLPLIVVRGALELSLPEVVAITLAFFVLEIPLSRLFFTLGLRDRPY
ncbi:MAG: CDP-archaeol synthase [Lacisediminimonas sp.]|nr:CDP-archaeol synthase [Lacisediminimonas sp.]